MYLKLLILNLDCSNSSLIHFSYKKQKIFIFRFFIMSNVPPRIVLEVLKLDELGMEEQLLKAFGLSEFPIRSLKSKKS